MPISPKEKTKKSFIREEEPGLLEKLGVRYYLHLGKYYRTDAIENRKIDELPDDIILQAIASNITTFTAIIAFSIGALTTFVTIWIEWNYKEVLSTASYYFLYGSVLAGMLVIELAVLFWLGLKTVYALSCLTGHNESKASKYLPVDDAIPNMLARAALEVPDPIVHYLGIDPMKHLSKSKLFMISLVYKAKVILSSLLVKYILIRLVGKGEVRFAFSWAAVPVTGFWDAFTMYKVAKEAKLRLFGHKLAEHIATEILTDELIAKLSPLCREGAIRAVATMMVLAQNYHPNMLVLLLRLCDAFSIDEHCDYDSWEDFVALLDRVTPDERCFLLDLLSVSAAFDGQLSRLEKHHLPEAFQEMTDTYMQRTEKLKDMLISGQLRAARDLCALDFIPG